MKQISETICGLVCATGSPAVSGARAGTRCCFCACCARGCCCQCAGLSLSLSLSHARSLSFFLSLCVRVNFWCVCEHVQTQSYACIHPSMDARVGSHTQTLQHMHTCFNIEVFVHTCRDRGLLASQVYVRVCMCGAWCQSILIPGY